MTDPRVEEALRAVPRRRFLPPEAASQEDVDAPLPIGEGQTVSAPHMVAIMAEALDVRPGHRVLEVGGGSGWHAAVLARLAGPGGRVWSVERLPALAERARASLASLPEPPPVEVVVGDGSLGLPAHAPYDRISVAAAAPALPPPLVAQLAPGGVLVAPVGPKAGQTLVRARRRDDGGVDVEPLMACLFVPLVGAHGFPDGLT